MPKKILLIEDEELMVSLLERKLTQEGYEVILARNGVEGLEKMREVKPNLILLDIVMPKMGGFEVMEEMAKEKELKDRDSAEKKEKIAESLEKHIESKSEQEPPAE